MLCHSIRATYEYEYEDEDDDDSLPNRVSGLPRLLISTIHLDDRLARWLVGTGSWITNPGRDLFGRVIVKSENPPDPPTT